MGTGIGARACRGDRRAADPHGGEFDAAPAGTVEMRISGLPTAPADAPAPVRVRVFVGGSDGLAPHGAPIDMLGPDAVVPGLPPADLYAVQAIDPLGLPGEPLLVEP